MSIRCYILIERNIFFFKYRPSAAVTTRIMYYVSGRKNINLEVNKPSQKLSEILIIPNFEIVVFETHEMLKYVRSQCIRV